jgi:hypothetical protein
MKELIYYAIFAIILYFVLSQVFDNFYLEQENFDPSLVPVSSIVTLAKVAQKLVNGNGTLTNPGNLQIGKDASAPGNLTVTGMATIGNNVGANVTGLTVNGNLNAKGYGLNVDNMINLGASNVQLGSDGAHGLKVMDENGGNGNITGKNLTLSGNVSVNTSNTAGLGNITTTGNITSGNITSGNITIPGGEIKIGATTGNNLRVHDRGVESNGGEMLIKSIGSNVRIWDSPLSVDKQFKAGNITINNGGNSPNLLYNNSGGDNLLIKAENRIVQIWSSNLNVDGSLEVKGDIKMNVDKALLIRGDGNHYIKYGGDDLNGPAIRGCQGGSLGTSAGCNGGTDKVALQWGNDKNVAIGGALTVSGKLSFSGLSNSAFPVGTYKIRAYGFRIPLYVGWNLMWNDHGWGERVRNQRKWNNSTDDRYINYCNVDMRNAGDSDNNWLARYYSLMPGYKLQFYASWEKVGPEYTGEQTFGDNAFSGRRVHAIAVKSISDDWTLPENLAV